MHSIRTYSAPMNVARICLLAGLMAMAAPLKAADCGDTPAVLGETADANMIRCALSRAQAENSARSLTIVEAEPEIEPVAFAINFEFGSAEITPASRELLARVAKVIAEDEELREAAYFVDGHTDAVGSETDNEALGRERAQATAGALLSGVDFAMTLKVRSFGEAQLADSDNPEAATNRRVEITPVGRN